MGLLSPSQVPDFFYVENSRPTSCRGVTRRARREMGVTFNGTRRTVLIEDVDRRDGRAEPGARRHSARVHRQAFIFLVSAGAAVDQAQVTKMDTIRRAWVTFFSQATGNRMKARDLAQVAGASGKLPPS